MAKLTTAERNKRKRDRKKQQRDQQHLEANQDPPEEEAAPSVEIEYVAELPPVDGEQLDHGDGDELQQVLRRFQSRSAVYITEDEDDAAGKQAASAARSVKLEPTDDGNINEGEDEDSPGVSKRKLKSLLRPTVSQLKQRVSHPELVEAHDVTAPDPEFLLQLKSIPGTVPVPRHWGRKRKYLQGKRGVEKAPFALPDYIVRTGICSVRDATKADEEKQSIKQKNRARVSGKGGTDVDYRTLYEAFFRHQTKPANLTKFGDLYYEGKEYETAKSSHYRVGFMSETLKEALGMVNALTPPPWLINMQRFGPPPSYPNIRIAGLNAPIPNGASYGYHVGGWGKPPVDTFGRPLYGGDPFGTPEQAAEAIDEDVDLNLYGLNNNSNSLASSGLVTSDGKALGKKSWGAMPSAFGDDDEEEGSDDEMEESSSEEESSEEEEEEEGQELEVPNNSYINNNQRAPGMDSVLPDGVDSVVPSSAIDLRKPGDETPMVGDVPKKQLYQVLQETAADADSQVTSVFASDHAYVLPGAGPGSNVPEGMGSVLSKSVGGDAAAGKARKRKNEEEDADDLGKKFKF
jgi:splicing factor 3B subunit 2